MKPLYTLVLFFFWLSFCPSFSYAQTQVGFDINGEEAFDFFGATLSLSADGDRLIAGAFGNSTNGLDAGLAGAFELIGGDWVQMGADFLGDAADYEMGAAVAISADGSRIAIGAPGRIGGFGFAGQVQVYEWINGNWTQLGTTLEGTLSGELFGTSVSLSSDGHLLAVGTPLKKGIASSSFTTGQVRVYEWIGEEWVQRGANINGMQDDLVGNAVSLSADGNRLAIDAIGNSDNGVDAGQVSVYEWVNNGWTLLGAKINGTAGEFLGCALRLSADGKRLAIGARGQSFNGKVKVYEFKNNLWTQLGEDFTGQAGDFLGCSVSLSADGKRLAIGALGKEDNGPDSGQAGVYEWIIDQWVQVGVNITGEENSGLGEAVSLSADGNRLAIGATYNTIFGSGFGKVIVIDLSIVSSAEVADISPLNIYPNPTYGPIYFDGFVPETLTLYDLYGRTVFQHQQHPQSINIAHLPKGVYLLKANSEGRSQSLRIVKQ